MYGAHGVREGLCLCDAILASKIDAPSQEIEISMQRILAELSICTLAESEHQCIARALIKSKGVVGGPNGAARILGVPKSTLQYRLKKYGLNPSDYQKINQSI